MIKTYNSSGETTFSSDKLPLKYLRYYDLNLTQFTNFTELMSGGGIIGSHAYYVLNIDDMSSYPVVVAVPQNMLGYTACTPIQENGKYTKLLVRLTYCAYATQATTDHKLRLYVYTTVQETPTSNDCVRVYDQSGNIIFSANSKVVQMTSSINIGCFLQKFVDGSIVYWGAPGYYLDYSSFGTYFYSLPGDGAVKPYLFKPQCKRYPVLNVLTYFWGTQLRGITRNRNIFWGLFLNNGTYSILKTSEAASIIDGTMYSSTTYPAHLTFSDNYIPPYYTYIYTSKYATYTPCPYHDDDMQLHILST